VSWLAPGQSTVCGECGESVAVPNESEPPLDRSRSPAGTQARVTWRNLILAGLIPSGMTVLALVLYPVAGILVALFPIVANLLLGRIVGHSVSRLRFLSGTIVAVAGWMVALFVIAGIAAAFVKEGQANTGAQGVVVFGAAILMVALATSPLAGLASGWGHPRAPAPPMAEQ
jgi:hypothetical protein